MSHTRPLVALVCAALVTASGCFGTPTGVRRKPAATPAVRKTATPRPSALPTIGTPPRLTGSPGAGPTPTPTVKATTAPVPSVSPGPAIVTQPIALNPLGSIGLAAETENYVVVGSASSTAVREMTVTAEEAGGYRLAAAPGPVPASGPPAGPAEGPVEAHAAFRRWQRALGTPPLALHKPAYALQQTPLAKGDAVPFWVITSFEGDDFTDKQVTAKVLEVGTHCYVVVDAQVLADPVQAPKIAERAKEIAATFDARIYPTDTTIFGSEPNPGIDKDPKIFILLTPAVGDYGKDATLGYFSQRDEFQPQTGGKGVFAHSNAKEMIYVSSRIVLTGSADDYLGTIAHEFQHMINYNQKVLLGTSKVSEDLWIDEGMAMYAIEANGYGLKAGGQVLANHVKRFMQEPEAFSLVDWDNNPEKIGYGPVYLFMVYLADRFSEAIIKAIVSTPKLGIPNMEETLNRRGVSLASVFHDWTLANLLDGRRQVTDPNLSYASLAMDGKNGLTALPGFKTQAFDLPGQQTFPLRPYTARYFRMPDGLIAPRFTLSAGATATKPVTEPRLVLPQDGF